MFTLCTRSCSTTHRGDVIIELDGTAVAGIVSGGDEAANKEEAEKKKKRLGMDVLVAAFDLERAAPVLSAG